MILPPGKLPPDILRSLLAGIETDDSVIVGPGIGRDAAAVRVGDKILVLKTDPITFATQHIGRYLVNINANDIACMGVDPRWLMVTALLPERNTSPEMVRTIFDDLSTACNEIGCALVGGHTEITEGLDRPILIGSMIGLGDPSSLLDPMSARPGDRVLLVAGVAIEGTAILATEFADELRETLDEETLHRARNFVDDPGISVVRYARLLRAALGEDLCQLHDPTEGGIATALHELAEATGCGIEIEFDRIHIYEETRRVSAAMEIDPLGLIASGSLLAIVRANAVDRATAAFSGTGVILRDIGCLTPDTDSRRLRTNGEDRPMPVFEVDEIARTFAGR